MRNNEFGIDNALWHRAMEEDETEETYQASKKEQALYTDITGSLGLWGVTLE